MKVKKAIKAIKKDQDLLRLAQEVNTIYGLDSLDPRWQTFPQKMSEYRKELAEKSIINLKKLETLQNKEIFLKYVKPVVGQNVFTKILRKFSCLN